MAQKILFSFHAAERMSQRLNIKVPTRQEVDISSAFFKAKTYRHHNGEMVEAWASKDQSNRLVLIVGQQSGVVLTVLVGSETNGRNTPFVDECYAGLRH